MTPEQTVAFRNPCFEAEETMHRRFARRLPFPFNDATVILTLNVGME